MSCTASDSATALVETASTVSAEPDLTDFPVLHAAAPKRAPAAVPRFVKLHGAPPEPRERVVLDILVSQVSALIGRKGKTVRAIEELTGAKISVKNAKAEDVQPSVVITARSKAAVAVAEDVQPS